MAKTKSQGGRRKSHPPGGSAPEINIRMYRVGFGDCFLVTLAGKYHILVDCGVHNKGNIAVDGESLIVHHDVHVGIAVDLDFKGLIAPVIRNADGKRLRLPIYAIAGYGYPDTLTLIQSQLKDVGIDVEQVLLEEAAIWGRLKAGEHTVMAMGMPHSNPDEILMYYFHSKNRPAPNRFNFADPKVDQLLEEGRTVSDSKRRQEIYADVQRRVIESAVWVPLWHPDRAMTMSAKVNDLRPHPVYDVCYHKLLDAWVSR